MRFFRDSSIHRKLAIVIICTSLLGLSTTGLAFELYEKASFRATLASELQAHADTLGLNTAASLAFKDRKSAEELLASLRVEPQIVAACIYDGSGNIFAEYRREGVGADFKMPVSQGDALQFGPESLTVFRSFSLAGQRTGGVAIISDFSVLHAKMKRFREISSLILIGSILLVAIVSSRLVGL